MINAASTNSSNTPFSCAYYGKDCHTVDRCYRKNSFPHNSSSRGGRSGSTGFDRGNLGGRGNKICTQCGFTNHTVDECYRKHEYPPSHKYHKPQGPLINNVNVVKEENVNSDVEQNQEAQGLDVKLIAQQCKA